MPTKSFRWRVVLAAFIGTMGVGCVVAAILGVLLMTLTSWTGKSLYEPGPQGFSKEGVVVCLWGLFGGGALVASAVQVWKGRWVWALLLFLLSIALGKSVDWIIPRRGPR